MANETAPALLYRALEQPSASSHSLHSPYSRWGRHTCMPQGGRYGRCPGSGMGWTSRDRIWPGQPGWADLRQGGSGVSAGRGCGDRTGHRVPRPPARNPGTAGTGLRNPLPKEMFARPPGLPRRYSLWIALIPPFTVHLSSLWTLLCEMELKTAPASWGWKD